MSKQRKGFSLMSNTNTAQNTLEIGDKMKDGTIFAGISPDTGRNIFVTPKDACGTLKWKAAMKYAAELKANGHKDWRLPTKAELYVLYQNRDEGALRGTFDVSDSLPSGWYWSSTERPGCPDNALVVRFSGGRYWNWEGNDASVRPVRSEPRP
jgi:hypothetical protein